MTNSAAIKGQKERKIPVMEKIASFTIDHIKLKPGVYVSRKDHVGDSVITTFDLRMTSPNDEPVMNTAEVHTIEHLGATFLRNHEEWKDKTVYFGPMGCRTGFYFLTRNLDPEKAIRIVRDSFEYIASYNGEIPGVSEKECGNYREHDLEGAKKSVLPFLEATKNYSADMLDYSYHMK